MFLLYMLNDITTSRKGSCDWFALFVCQQDHTKTTEPVSECSSSRSSVTNSNYIFHHLHYDIICMLRGLIFPPCTFKDESTPQTFELAPSIRDAQKKSGDVFQRQVLPASTLPMYGFRLSSACLCL